MLFRPIVEKVIFEGGVEEVNTEGRTLMIIGAVAFAPLAFLAGAFCTLIAIAGG